MPWFAMSSDDFRQALQRVEDGEKAVDVYIDFLENGVERDAATG